MYNGQLADKQLFYGYNGAMTKREIARAVSEKLNITQQEAKRVVQNILDAIKDTLVEEHRIELRNFGVLEVRTHDALQSTHAQSGKAAGNIESTIINETGNGNKSRPVPDFHDIHTLH